MKGTNRPQNTDSRRESQEEVALHIDNNNNNSSAVGDTASQKSEAYRGLKILKEEENNDNDNTDDDIEVRIDLTKEPNKHIFSKPSATLPILKTGN